MLPDIECNKGGNISPLCSAREYLTSKLEFLHSSDVASESIETENSWGEFFIYICIFFLLLTILKSFLVPKKRSIIRKLKEIIPKEKIIIAFEFENIIAKLSSCYKQGFLPLNIKTSTDQSFMTSVLSWIRPRIFYKALFSLQKLRSFFTNLRQL